MRAFISFPTHKQDYAQMSDNLDKYLPEFDEEEARGKLTGLTAEQLTDMLIHAYKLKRVIAKMLDEEMKKMRRIEDILGEPSSLLKMPGIPTSDDLRRMSENED
jgi:hypothetical protein